MKRARQITVIASALAACAGPSLRGQVTPSGVQGVRPNIYEVMPEQVAPAGSAGFIEVSGTATVGVAPDQALVSFAMETRAEAAGAAASANADAMDRVLGALRAGGFQSLELRTFGYALRPEYASDNARGRRIVAYVATNNVGATISDVDAVGRLVDVAIAAGANRVSGIAFSASDTDAARRAALAEAVSSARQEAEAMAAALGHRLGSPLEVRGGAQRPTPVAYESQALRAGALAVAETPIEAGDQTVRASVTIRFALGPELTGR